MATQEQENPMGNTKLLQYLNEILSVENAAIERLQLRIKETSMSYTKQQLQQHLEETKAQQQRLKNIISNRGGNPTSAKADLPIINPKTETTARVDEMVESATTTKEKKERIKSVVAETENVMMKPEKELMEVKQDAIIENAEVVAYKILIDVSAKVNAEDAIIVLKQNLQEEESMFNWIMTNTPRILDQLWRYIESSAGTRTLNA
jgi:ferritin-like metal-binding protein YciE